MECRRHRSIARSLLLATGFILLVAEPSMIVAGNPATDRDEAIASIPYSMLTPAAATKIRGIVERPTIYRRLPPERIECDPSMFVFLVRHPDVIVGIWQRMEISKVETQRIGPYQLVADDHAGTTCTVDLIYGDATTHIYVARGKYDGPLVPRPVTGSGVFILRSQYAGGGNGPSYVHGTLDCFLQLDNLGVDLVARTFSGMIGKTADQNFVETAKFMAQISQAAGNNPTGMRDLALDLPVEPKTREAFAEAIIDVALRSGNRLGDVRGRHGVPFLAKQPTPASLER